MGTENRLKLLLMENHSWTPTYSSAALAALYIAEHGLDNNAVIGPRTLVYMRVYA